MNDFQKAALRIYAEGDHCHLIEEPPSDLLALGDTLLSFVLIELSNNEGCESWQDAISRIRNGIEDLETVLSTLEEQA